MFYVDSQRRHGGIDGDTEIFGTFDEAPGLAVSRGQYMGPQVIDITVASVAGARWLAGDEGVRQYREEPDATVFERIVVKAESKGRVH